MPDNSKRNVYQSGLPSGRRPAGILPTIPYRIEEWGKSRSYRLTEGAAQRLMSLKYPTNLEEHERAVGPIIPKRGPPSIGVIILHVGEETKRPVLARTEWGAEIRVVEEGLAYTKKEARERLDAYLRRRQRVQAGKARRRASKRSHAA